MRRSVYSVLCAILCTCILCSCKQGGDGEVKSTPITVNLTVPTEAPKTAPPSERKYEDRLFLNAAVSVDENGISSVSKLYLRYTNTSAAPVYSLEFSMPKNTSVKSVSVNGVASNFTKDEESLILTIPAGAELKVNSSVFICINYTASGCASLSDTVLRFNGTNSEFLHNVSVTVPNEYSVSSSLSEPGVSTGTKTTFTFSAISKSDFTLSLDR